MVELHLALNHFPLYGLLFSLILLGSGILKKKSDIIRMGLYLNIIVAIITPLVYISGESAEEIVEKIPDVKKSLIDRHEDIAIYALLLTELTGLLSLIHIISRKGISNGFFIKLIVISTLMASTLIGFTSRMGGEIRHTELTDPYTDIFKHEIEDD